MIGHLGSRVSALLDGHLDPVETERAWSHVHECHHCRDLVEREGWVKRRLARLSDDGGGAPDHLKGSLLGAPDLASSPALTPDPVRRTRRAVGVGAATVGGGAVGAAMLGVLALGASPAAAPTAPTMTPTMTPTLDQRVPLTRLTPLGPTLPAPSAVVPALDRSGRGSR